MYIDVSLVAVVEAQHDQMVVGRKANVEASRSMACAADTGQTTRKQRVRITTCSRCGSQRPMSMVSTAVRDAMIEVRNIQRFKVPRSVPDKLGNQYSNREMLIPPHYTRMTASNKAMRMMIRTTMHQPDFVSGATGP